MLEVQLVTKGGYSRPQSPSIVSLVQRSFLSPEGHHGALWAAWRSIGCLLPGQLQGDLWWAFPRLIVARRAR